MGCQPLGVWDRVRRMEPSLTVVARRPVETLDDKTERESIDAMVYSVVEIRSLSRTRKGEG